MRDPRGEAVGRQRRAPAVAEHDDARRPLARPQHPDRRGAAPQPLGPADARAPERRRRTTSDRHDTDEPKPLSHETLTVAPPRRSTTARRCGSASSRRWRTRQRPPSSSWTASSTACATLRVRLGDALRRPRQRLARRDARSCSKPTRSTHPELRVDLGAGDARASRTPTSAATARRSLPAATGSSRSTPASATTRTRSARSSLRCRGNDCVFGSRFTQGARNLGTPWRRTVSRGGTLLTNLVLGTQL